MGFPMATCGPCRSIASGVHSHSFLPPLRIVDGRRASLRLCHQGVWILVSLHHFRALLSLQAIFPQLASFHQAGVPLSCSSQSRLSP